MVSKNKKKSIEENNIETFYDYNLLNKDVETCSDYFDVVPDGNLYTFDDYPIFAIRMRPKGIYHIMDRYNKKYKISCEVLTYKINEKQYTLYTNNTYEMYLKQKNNILQYFDFERCSDGDFKAIIIVVVNNDNRTIHAIPYIYGKINFRKKIIFLDPFYSIDLGSGCIVGAEFFYNNYDDIDCYCHGFNIQADHHSCGIIACDFVKNCLKNKAKLAKQILENVKMRTTINNPDNGLTTTLNIYELPNELKKFSQTRIQEVKEKNINESKNSEEKENKNNWFSSHFRKLIYRRDPEPYNPDGLVIPENNGIIKEINTALLEKGHKYAKKIIKEVGNISDYNANYWLTLIKEQDGGNIIKKIIKRARKIVKNDNLEKIDTK